MCAILFLCREVLGVNVDGLSLTAMAKRGTHLPVVLSVPEAVALLGAVRGTTWLMAALIALPPPRRTTLTCAHPSITFDILTAHFVQHPDWFDVVIASNLFGDILSGAFRPAGE